MNYSNNIFGKDLRDLTYSDIEKYFNEEKEENDNIEYKSYSENSENFNKNFDGVIRGICAFLNSDGGILIWGAPEGKTNENGKKIFTGDLSPVPYREKDWLISKISDSITPLPIGIKVEPIKVENDSYLYIFEIQKSIYSPHQFKNTYYARLDGQTKPAPHYLIEALFKKISFPQLEGYVKPKKIDHDGHNYFLDIEIYIFNFSELQNEENVYFRLICPQGIFLNQDSKNQILYRQDTEGGSELINKGLIDILHFGQPNFQAEQIQFNPYNVHQYNKGKVNLLLIFGGRRSPLKSSWYELDFSKIDWSSKDPPKYLINGVHENKLFSKIQEENDTTRETTLRNLDLV